MKKTLVDLFESSVARYGDNVFLWEKTGKKYEPTTYKELRQMVYELGAGFRALGVKKGDNMALLSEGRNAWIISELAMFYAGATNVPLSIKLEEANDLLQETSLRALQNMDKYTPDTNFKGWVYTIMRNIFINNYRKVLREQTFVDYTDNLHNIDSVQLTLDSVTEND